MEFKGGTGNYYNIRSLVLFTGLTDRTIRNYISLGLLEGEKINGLWHFTPEQVERFIRHPAVRPSIQAKNNGIVYDFLIENKRKQPECCIILDLPGEDKKETAEFFCYRINQGDYKNIRFSFDAVEGTPRVIIRGGTEDVLGLVNEWRNR